MKFKFDNYTTNVYITNELPNIRIKNALFVCDENTRQYAEPLRGSNPVCVIKSGEENKNYGSVLKILSAAKDAGLGRDGAFIGVGGGVIGDLTGFAASVYMRGCRLQLVATTLLAMVDASVGGKTGFDLFDIKNLCGSFYPAEIVYMPLETLKTLPEREYKSGMAELIKTLILMGEEHLSFDTENDSKKNKVTGNGERVNTLYPLPSKLYPFIKKAVKYKGNLVEKDFKETKGKRVLLNLGHTFGHALETAAGLGTITHGEAVAWGIVQACYLGAALNITPLKRAKNIIKLIESFGYNCETPHPLADTESFKKALLSDKKKKNKHISFVVPDKKGAKTTVLENTNFLDNLLKDGFKL